MQPLMVANIKKVHLAWDCLDKHEASWVNKHKTALIVVSDVFPKKHYTFSQLSGLTNRFAHALKQHSSTKKKRVLICLPNGVEFIISFLGALKAGAIPVPASPLYTWNELRFLLQDSQAKIVITTPEICPDEIWNHQLPSLKTIILSCPPNHFLPKTALRWENLLKDGEAKAHPLEAGPDDEAYWLYTSGTTGNPKGAVHAHRSISAHDQRAKMWQGVSAGDITFNTSALNWSYALTSGLLDLWRHGQTAVIYAGKPDAAKYTDIIQGLGVTTFMSVPGIYRRLCQEWRNTPPRFPNLKFCLSAGEILQPNVRDEFKNLTGLDIHQGLGMTENSVYLVQPINESPIKDSVGKSVFGDQVQILREDQSPAPPGETGILATSTQCPGLMLGYHRSDGSLEKPWQGDWFLSGDLAYQDENGNFYFTGRRDDMITAGGYRISPLEVEQVLNRHADVMESAVVGYSENEQTCLAAHVVLHPSTVNTLDPDQLKDFAKKYLAAYKIPRRIVFKDTLPKTVTGKLKRSLLTLPK